MVESKEVGSGKEASFVDELKLPLVVSFVVLFVFKLIGHSIVGLIFVILAGCTMLYLGSISRRHKNPIRRAVMISAIYGTCLAIFLWLIDTARLLSEGNPSGYTAFERFAGFAITAVVFSIGSIVIGLFGFLLSDRIVKK